MQVAYEVFRGAHVMKEDSELSVNSFRLPFGKADFVPSPHRGTNDGDRDVERELTTEQLAHVSARAKAVWAARLGAFGVNAPAEVSREGQGP